MSIFEEKQPMVTICKVKKILKHPNADRLEIAEIKGWQVVCQKDIYKEGDLVIYFEIDSVLPEDVEDIIFGKDAKIKLSKSRVKTIRIRQMYSQGLICPIVLLQERITKKIKEGIDISDDLGVKKYEEPISKSSKMYVQPIKKKYENPNFHKVRKPQNIKNFKDLFIGKEVSVTEKVHGTSVVIEYVKRPSATFMDKLNIFIFGKYEFCYRSMSVQLQKRKSIWQGILKKIFRKPDTGFYEKEIGKDVYSEAVKNYKLKDILDQGYGITGEIYGDGIQKNYSYSLKTGERKLICYGVRKDGINVQFKEAKQYCEKIGLQYVPVLFEGILTEEILSGCTNGKSKLDDKTIKEGCVVELTNQENSSIVILKSISEAYLLKNENGTDFH